MNVNEYGKYPERREKLLENPAGRENGFPRRRCVLLLRIFPICTQGREVDPDRRMGYRQPDPVVPGEPKGRLPPSSERLSPGPGAEKKEASKESRKEFIDEALSYINSDFDYRIMDVIYAACYDKDELYYFAENIRSNSPEMAMKIYKQLSEKEEYLKLRLDNLESSSDYYNLVQFYEENNEPQKAIKTAYEGLQKVQYHKGDLQEYLAEKALNSNNREEYLKLKFDKYTDRLTLQDYKSFENICNKKEWQQYESKIISKVEKLHSSNKLLIYMHRKEFEKVFRPPFCGAPRRSE